MAEVARGGLADEERPGHVRAVALDLRPEVEEQHLAGSHATGRPGEPWGSAARGPDRQATSKASPSAPPVRMRHSRASARSRSVTPDADVGQRVARGPRRRPRRRRAMRSSSAGSLTPRAGSSTRPSTGTSSTSGAAAARRQPGGVAEEASLDARPAGRPDPAGDADRPQAPDQLRPCVRELARDLLDAAGRALLERLEAVARVGHHDRLVRRDEEATRGPADLLLAVTEHEAGQVAGVLRPQPEVGVQALPGEALPQALRGGAVAPPGRRPPAIPVAVDRAARPTVRRRSAGTRRCCGCAARRSWRTCACRSPGQA